MEYEIHSELDIIIQKLSKKDKALASMLIHKIDEIKNSEYPEHYKNLKSPFQRYKRVHITEKFVLMFEVIEKEDLIMFRYFDHRDNIYNRRFD